MTAARAQTEVDVANLALVNHLGELPIGTLADANNRARAVNAVFGTARDAALRDNDWNFATAWITPAALTVKSIGPYKNRFPMPDDCVRVRAIADNTLVPTTGVGFDPLPEECWDIEAATVNPGDLPSANVLMVTNVVTPLVCYTRRIVLPQLWDAEFVDVFAEILAAMAAPAILKDPQAAKTLRDAAKDTLSQAALDNAREAAPRQITRTTSWVTARRLGTVYRPPFRDSGM